MKYRSVAAVILLPLITFGIYSLYWHVRTKIEMNLQGAKIPTAWLLIVPIVNIWWLWKFSEGVEHVTGGKATVVVVFILEFLLGIIGSGIVQYYLNDVAKQQAPPAPVPAAPAA